MFGEFLLLRWGKSSDSPPTVAVFYIGFEHGRCGVSVNGRRGIEGTHNRVLSGAVVSAPIMVHGANRRFREIGNDGAFFRTPSE